MSEPTRTTLEAELRSDAGDWADGNLVRLYADSRQGLRRQAAEAAILAGHGYLTQSSELTRDGTLMVAYVKGDEADLYPPLAHPGVGAATDPNSLFARFARPVAWLLAIGIFIFAVWLLVTALA
jgi:Na+-transporting methylmalonyl-CoA/oxaloacetate decarboxylase beta subunit